MTHIAAMPTRGYLVCCTERTGSNLLTGALARTGAAGRPLEYFNHSDRDKPWMKEILGDADFVDGIAEIAAAGSTPNGVFGAKIHFGHFRRLGMMLNGEWARWSRGDGQYRVLSTLPSSPSPAAALELLWACSPDLRWQTAALDFFRSQLPNLQFVWITRQNMVARAISLIRARRTGRWWQSASSTEAPADAEQDFDMAEIHIRYCLGLFEEALWRRFFDDNGIVPHRVVYEAFTANYEQTVREVLDFLGIDTAKTPVTPPRSAIQSDRLSLAWEERYRRWSAEAGFEVLP